MAARRPVAPAPTEGFVVSARVLFMSLLTAAIVAAGSWQFSTLQNVNLELAKLAVQVQAQSNQLLIFATKEELKRVEQKIDTHIIEGDRRYSELKSGKR